MQPASAYLGNEFIRAIYKDCFYIIKYSSKKSNGRKVVELIRSSTIWLAGGFLIVLLNSIEAHKAADEAKHCIMDVSSVAYT
jgi:hypothetical protein